MRFRLYWAGISPPLWHNRWVDSREFELILQATCDGLRREIDAGKAATDSAEFEVQVRSVLAEQLTQHRAGQALAPKVQGFPDIVVGPFGIEVKFTVKDTWISVANSIHESHRAGGIEQIYILFGKMGGAKDVRFGRYEKVVYHARTSHRPRFQVDMTGGRPSLFERLGISYVQFAALTYKEKMGYMRVYARSRKGKNLDFWWLEDDLTPYTTLSTSEKRKLRAEAAFLLPALIDSSDKDALLKMAQYMAASKRVLLNESSEVFGSNVLSAFAEIEEDIQVAALTMIQGVVEEYWGHNTPPKARLAEWIRVLDQHSPSNEVRPSQVLFGGAYAQPAS